MFQECFKGAPEEFEGGVESNGFQVFLILSFSSKGVSNKVQCIQRMFHMCFKGDLWKFKGPFK